MSDCDAASQDAPGQSAGEVSDCDAESLDAPALDACGTVVLAAGPVSAMDVQQHHGAAWSTHSMIRGLGVHISAVTRNPAEHTQSL